ncbi:MAG: hypothetical protein Q7T33_01660 [Dehalococcoidia bacterium]|nr:hypothetical protein [Dehalococcoidia bacterium]
MVAKARKRERHRGQVRRARWWVYLAGAAAAGVVVAAVIVAGALTRGGDNGIEGQVIVPTPGVSGLVSAGRVLGEQGAPISIVEYADFQ